MDHLQASSLLTRLIAGELDPARRRAVRRHLSDCQNCRAWVETAELMAALGADPESQASTHPPSGEVVEFALAPEALAADARQRVERHLAGCAECREAAALARASVEEARPASRRWPVLGPWVGPRRPTGRRWRAAVGLLLAASLAVGVGLWFGRPSRTPEEASVSGGVLEGERTLSARRSIVVEATEVSSGATVVLQGGQVVAFGDGFAVGQGATLTVSNKQPNEKRSSGQTRETL